MAAAEVSALCGAKERDGVCALTAAGTFAGTAKKMGADGALPQAPAAPGITNEAGVLSKEKLSHIFSSFLKILVDKSVGICYYN